MYGNVAGVIMVKDVQIVVRFSPGQRGISVTSISRRKAGIQKNVVACLCVHGTLRHLGGYPISCQRIY